MLLFDLSNFAIISCFQRVAGMWPDPVLVRALLVVFSRFPFPEVPSLSERHPVRPRASSKPQDVAPGFPCELYIRKTKGQQKSLIEGSLCRKSGSPSGDRAIPGKDSPVSYIF